MSLTYNIQEAMEVDQEQQALQAGVPQKDIDFSRSSGIDPRDVRIFREYSRKGVLVIVRCPKKTARAWHGRIPAKPISLKEKSGSSGVAVASTGRMFVSDYDLMSVWRQQGKAWQKVIISAAHGAARGPYPVEGTLVLKDLNRDLVSRIKHGCQDDFCSPQNPGVNATDHFAAFYNGLSEHLSNSTACKMFYERLELPWLYGPSGTYLYDAARQALGWR